MTCNYNVLSLINDKVKDNDIVIYYHIQFHLFCGIIISIQQQLICLIAMCIEYLLFSILLRKIFEFEYLPNVYYCLIFVYLKT